MAMSVLSVVGQFGIPAIHLMTVLLHGLSSLLLLRLLRPLPGAVGAAAVFAVHPLASEVLGWASALPDALSVSLALLSAVTGGPVLAGIATLAALLSKESALLVLPALIAARLAPRRLLWGWLGAVLLWAVLRMASGTGAGWVWQDRLHLVPAAILWPISSMVIPYPLTAVRDLLSVSMVSVVGGGTVLLTGLFLGYRSREALVGLGLILLAAAIALPPTLDGYLAAERYAYVGLIGLSVWIAALLPRRFAPLIGIVSGLSLATHIHQSQRWMGNVPLFQSATEAMPSSSYSWHLLGHSLATEQRFSAAADAFKMAIETGHPYPDDAELHLITLVHAGRTGEALAWAEAGPREGLTATWIAWWAKAAHDTGHHEQARAILAPLFDGQRWDGPDWVPELAAQLQSSP